MTGMDWRTSSYSNGTNCIEVGSWRTSSHSFSNGNCLEVGSSPGVVGVQTKQDGAGPVLVIGADEWRRFTAALKG